MRTQRMQYVLISLFLLAATALSGCSSGTGGGDAATSPPLAAATVTASGLLKLGAVGATTDIIDGIDMRINLPAGVTVEADPATGETAAGAVTISGAAAEGNNSLVAAKYTPAAGGTPATLHMVVINAAGFHRGEFATVRFNLANGVSFPALSAFTVTSFSAKGADSSTLSGIAGAPLSVDAVGNAAAKIKAQQVFPGDQSYLNISIDTPTKNPSQTITGTLFPGDLLVISTNTTATVSAPTITGGAWYAQVSGLAQGSNIIAVTETDPSGSTIVASVSATIIRDTKSPNLTLNTVLGTKDSFIWIDGTVDDLPYYDSVAITVNCPTAIAGMAVITGTSWGAMVNNLSYGDNLCTVTATDWVGNQGHLDARIYYDNIAPSLSIHANTLAKYNWVQTVSGTVESGVTPTVTVSTLATVSTVTVTGNSWTTQISGLPEGDNVITVTAADSFGNIATKTATISVYLCNGSFTGGQPTVADALKALRIAVGLDIPLDEDLIRGDLFVDANNRIDLADAILILKNAIGLFDNNLSFNNLYPQLLY